MRPFGRAHADCVCTGLECAGMGCPVCYGYRRPGCMAPYVLAVLMMRVEAHAHALAERELVGDLANWQPTGILAALKENEPPYRITTYDVREQLADLRALRHRYYMGPAQWHPRITDVT